MTSNNPVLITGGAGLLGSALVYQLLAAGEQQPVVLDLAADPQRLANIRSKIEYIQDDLGREGAISEHISRIRPSRIFHLGAVLGQDCENNPPLAQRVNVEATFELLETARECGVGQVIFASSVATFGYDLPERLLSDNFLQRPITFYGVTKLYGEGAGLFFRRKYGLDFRSLRYPFIVGPGTRQGGVVDYPTEMIVKGIQGKAYTANVPPETRIHVLHVIDAARAMRELSEAPKEKIRSVNYLVDGVRPAPSAGEIAEMVSRRFPEAKFSFQPDEKLLPILENVALPIDDSRARKEWGWQPRFDYQRIIDDFLELLA
jgi:threonine 3-dehydrogenase